MRFRDQVSFGYKPDNLNPSVSPQKYESLSDEDRYYFTPDYKRYKTIKVRDYSECDECGHREFNGWAEKKIPVGEPYRYVLTAQIVPYSIYRDAMNGLIDSATSSNVIAERILNK